MNKSNNKEYFRIFIGTYVNDQEWFKDYLSFIKKFENTYKYKIRWVSLNNLHMTWKFLGDVTLNRVSRIIDELNATLKEFKPMHLYFNNVELWPSNISPRQIVFTGVDKEDNITKNFKIFDKSLVNVGCNPEKRLFRPHITLGRFKIKEKLPEPINLLHKISLESFNLKITNIELIRSSLSSNGPIYEVLHSFNL